MANSDSKLKGCLAIVGFFVAFFTTVPYIAGGGLKELLFPYEKEQLKLVLANARVTDASKSRQQYTYYLDGNELTGYSFNGYVHAEPARREEMDPDLSYNPSDLGHYLRQGDRLTKAANSPLIMVHRGSIVTHWVLACILPEDDSPVKMWTFLMPANAGRTP